MSKLVAKAKRNDNSGLSDSEDDKKHLASDKATLDLPDVDDIPGQEHVRPLPPGEMADTTASSDDEEGYDLLDTDEDELLPTEYDANVTRDERQLLDESAQSTATEDDILLREARVDATDEEGAPLNEKAGLSGEDLDVPGSAGEDPGEEDEENDAYSLNDDKEDPVSTRQ